MTSFWLKFCLFRGNLTTTITIGPTILQTIWPFNDLQKNLAFYVLLQKWIRVKMFRNIFADLPKGKVEPQRPLTFRNLGISRFLKSLMLYKFGANMKLARQVAELKKDQGRSPNQNCRPKMFLKVRKSRQTIKATKQHNFHIFALFCFN